MKIRLIAITILLSILVACSNSQAMNPTENELGADIQESESTEQISSTEKEDIKYQTLYVDNKITMPEKSQGSYLATVKGKYSQIAYLGHEYKVQTSNSNPKWSTSTPDILMITSDGYVMAKKQGLGVVNDGKSNITIACTNINDGGDPYSWETILYDNNYWDGGQYSYELWQDKVNSITDYLRFVYEQSFEYGDVSF